MVQAVEQQAAIRKSGHRVMQRQVGDCLFDFLALRQIERNADPAGVTSDTETGGENVRRCAVEASNLVVAGRAVDKRVRRRPGRSEDAAEREAASEVLPSCA